MLRMCERRRLQSAHHNHRLGVLNEALRLQPLPVAKSGSLMRVDHIAFFVSAISYESPTSYVPSKGGL